MRDQVGEQVDVIVIHEGDRVDKKLKLVDKQVVQILLVAEIELPELVSHLILSVVREKTEVCHHLKIVTLDYRQVASAALRQSSVQICFILRRLGLFAHIDVQQAFHK
jgi:hypothetical protein